MKKIIKLMFIIMVVILLTGCTPHNKNEVKKYVRELLNHNYFRLTGSKKEGKWTVKDYKTGYTFNVIDFWYYESEFGHYKLVNDINDTLLKDLHNKMNDSNIELVIDEDPPYYDYTTVNFECKFNNLNELKDCVTSFKTYESTIEKYNENSKKPYVIYNFTKIYVYEKDNRKYYPEYKHKDQDDYDFVKEKYFEYGVHNQINSIMEEMNSEDYGNYSNKRVYRQIGDTKKYYSNISNKLGEISMEALFKILKEEGYNIEGEDPYYTITYTQDGTTQTYKTKPYKSFDDSYDIVGSDGVPKSLCISKERCRIDSINRALDLNLGYESE